jgi:hypothetical protein
MLSGTLNLYPSRKVKFGNVNNCFLTLTCICFANKWEIPVFWQYIERGEKCRLASCLKQLISFFLLRQCTSVLWFAFFVLFPSKCSAGCLPLFFSLLQMYATACFGLIGLLQTYKLLLEGGSFKATAAVVGSFLCWHCASAMHEFSFMVSLAEFVSCYSMC